MILSFLVFSQIMILHPGYRRPLDMDSVFIIKPGTAIIISPLYDYMITLEVKQLGHSVEMVVSTWDIS